MSVDIRAGKKESIEKDIYKITIIGFLLIACMLLIYHFHFILITEIVFTHLFYVLIILASLWYSRKGIAVTVFLALLLLISHILSPLETHIWANVARASMFVLVGIMVDILNQKSLALREKLRHSLEYQEKLINNTNAPIIVWDPKWRIIRVNHAFEHLTGYTSDEVVGKEICMLFSKATQKKSLEKIERTLKSAGMESIGIPITCKDGDTRLMLYNLANTYSSDGTTVLETIACGMDISEYKQAEDALRESESQKQALLDNSPDVIILIDTNMKIQWANKTALDMNPDAIGQTCHKAYAGGDEPCKGCPCEKAIRTGQIETSVKYQPALVGVTGESYWEDIGVPLKDSDGKVVNVIEIARDVTKRKHTEQMIKHKLEIEQAIAAVSSIFVAPTDIDDAIEAALEKVGRLCGASRSYIFLFHEKGSKMDNTYEWCAEELEPEKCNLQNLPSDMYLRWMTKLQNDETIHISDVSSLPPAASAEKEILEMQDIRSILVLPLYLDGKVAGFIGIDNVVNTGVWKDDDITALRMVSNVIGMAIERKRSEKELRTTHQQLIDIIEFLPDATFVIDAEKKVIAWNRAIEKMTGVQKEEIIGKGDYAYAVPFYGKRRPILIDLVFLPDSEIEQKYNFVEKKNNSLYTEAFVPFTYGGKGAYLSGKASPLFDTSGNRIGAIESIRDITKRKRDEEELKKYAEKLEYSNELKDLFTDIMRHDLLNPAGIVKGHTEILLDMEKGEQERRSLHAIERNTERLIDMIETASKFAKLESVEELEFEEMDIGVIFKEVIENFRPGIEEKQMIVELAADGTCPANVNPVIEDVFANLLSNAIKYSPENSRIVIDVIDAGKDWKVTVTDFGEGISDEDKSSVFERFKRVEKGTAKGSGLGLAIVKRIIDLHGGSVGVLDNPQGQGSVFWVTIKKHNH